jgi:DNA-binding IclR family transcriptional regulator
LTISKKPAKVPSIFRAAQIINCIGNRINTVSKIAAETRLSNSTVHRLLQALEYSDMVIQDSVSRKYYFGNLINKLVIDDQIPYQYIIAIIKEPISRLAEVTGESISLAVLIGQTYNPLFEVPSEHRLRVVESEVNIIEPIRPYNAA